MRKTESQKIALCGMLGALSVVLLLIGSALQIGTYAAPMLAAFLLIPVLEDYGPRYALTLYATVSILAVLFVPETELAFFYVLVMGYYPVLRVKLNTTKKQVGALDHKICCIQCGHCAGLSFAVCIARSRCSGRAAGRWNGHAGGAFGRGQPVLLAVRPGAGCADAVLPSGGQAKTEKEVLILEGEKHVVR